MIQLIIGAIGLIVFLIPTFEGVFNIGSLIGVSLFGGLLLWGIFRKRIKELLPRIREKKAGKIITNAFCLCFCIVMLYTAVGGVLVLSGMKTTDKDCPVIITLGCKVREDETPSSSLRFRLDAALEYLGSHPETICIVSGGQGPDEPMTEAECMKRYLIANGIDKERIIKEDRSTSTKENLVYSNEIIKSRFGDETPAVGIVTSNYHEYRAGIVARKNNMDTYFVPAYSPVELLPVYFTREIFGIIGERFFR